MNTRSDTFLIHDRTALAAVVEAMIELVGEGHEKTTADAIGISASTLNRMRHCIVPHTTRQTILALERGTKMCRTLAPKLASRLRAAIVAPETQQYFQAYMSWCEQRKTRWQESEGTTWKVGAFMQLEPNAAPGLALAPLRQEMVRMLWQRVHQEFPEIFRKFRDEMVRRGVDEVRQEVAIIRVIEPMLEATQCAYVERSYSELTERERRDFIDAGIKRESILLDREPALTRARRIAEQGADVFAKQEGERALYAKERTTPASLTRH